MAPLRIGITRFASVAREIARALGEEQHPDCRIDQGRMYITFRHLGASRWEQERQAEFALRAAATARRVLAEDPRPSVRRRTKCAVVVRLEDVAVIRDCAVTARWECVVPRPW